jgi:DNA-binding IclR family transcriptional regulator
MKELPAPVFDDALMNRIRGEFLEMPCLRLTFAQAQRLFGLDAKQCRRMLDALVAHRFLVRRPDGLYGRLTEGVVALAPGLGMKSATHLKRTA